MYTMCSELVVFMYWTGKSMNNLLSYCGLVDVRINASDKDLPVQISATYIYVYKKSNVQSSDIWGNGVQRNRTIDWFVPL